MAAQRDFVTCLWKELAGVSKYARRYALATALAVSVLGLVPNVRAQQSPPPAAPAARPDKDTTRGELQSFDRFLDHHPRLARALRKDPTLVNNPDFLAKHKRLERYLKEHPRAQAALKENPNAFMKREATVQKSGKRARRLERHEHKEGRENQG